MTTIIDYYLKDSANRIDAILKNKDKKTFNPEDYKKTLNSVLINIHNITTEIEVSTDDTANHLPRFVYNLLRDIDTLCKEKESFIDDLSYLHSQLVHLMDNMYFYNDYFNQYSMESTSNKSLDTYRYLEMMNTVNMNNVERPVNILDTEGNTNEALDTIKKGYGDDVMCYAIADRNIHNSENIDRYIVSGKKGRTYVSNDAFDIIVHSPSLAVSLDTLAFSFEKQERDSIRNSINYLRPYGVYFLVIPAFRIYSDIANLLSRNLKDIQVYELLERDCYSDHRPVVIRGVKREKRLTSSDPDDYLKLRSANLNYENTSYMKELDDQCINFDVVDIPSADIEIKHFRGSSITDRDIINIANTSGCYDDIISKQDTSSDLEDRQPLVPFAFGQIGLVLSSGCVDGLIDEGDGNYHLVKGRTVKMDSDNETVEDDMIIEERTTRNKVEINALFPDGTYKTLA